MSASLPIPSPVIRSGALRHEGVVTPRGTGVRVTPSSAVAHIDQRARRRRFVLVGFVAALLGVFAWAETPDARSSAPTSKASPGELAREGAATKPAEGPANLSFLLYGPLGPKVDGIKLNPYASWQAGTRHATARPGLRSARQRRGQVDRGVMRKVDDPKPNPYQ